MQRRRQQPKERTPVYRANTAFGTVPRARSAFGKLLCLCVLASLSGFFPGPAHGTTTQGIPVAAAPGLPFAFADFNGDNHPDFASIQPGDRKSANTSDYWIEVRLSQSGTRLIHLVAQSGGLNVEARDVNGDHAVDLVLTTAWASRPVAILLNDGHGNFRRVEPASFPSAFRRSKANWAARATQVIESLGVVQESRTAACAQVSDAQRLTFAARTFPFPTLYAPISFLTSGAGRAPPSVFLSL
jgi:hypothetical protein